MFEYADIEAIAEENIYLRGLLNTLTGSDQPVQGLTVMMSRIVFMLRNAHGRHLTRENIIEILHHATPGDFPVANVIPVHLTRIRQRRPDIGVCIENQHGGMWRWARVNETSRLTLELEE